MRSVEALYGDGMTCTLYRHCMGLHARYGDNVWDDMHAVGALYGMTYAIQKRYCIWDNMHAEAQSDDKHDVDA
jgi:hypothetical protein